MGQGLRFFLLGSAVGLAAAVALVRLIQNLLFGVEATDPWAFAGAWVVLLAVTLAACLIPARRAARLEPLTAIRRQP